jgi:DME family drug/metabolite transporter
MSRQKNESLLGSGLVVGAAVLWGTVGPAQVLARAPIGPAALGGWRLLLGGVVLGVFCAPHLRRFRVSTARRAWRTIIVCSLSTGLYQVAFLHSVSRTGAALATVVALGTAPVATGICARWVTGERIRTAWVVSTVAAVGGCALLLTPGGDGVDSVGLMLGGVAGACYGLYTVFAKKLALENPDVDAPTAAAISLVTGALMLLPWIATDTMGLPDLRSVSLIMWLGIATSAAAYWMFATGLNHVNATTAGTLSLVEPLAATALGVLVVGEHLSATAVAGCLLLLGGLAAVSLPYPRRLRHIGTPGRAVTGDQKQLRPPLDVT